MIDQESEHYHEGEIEIQHCAGVRDQAEMIVQVYDMPDLTRPEYIQQRSFERVTGEAGGDGTTMEGLEPAHRDWIEGTDTFFLGSYYPETGADASHVAATRDSSTSTVTP